MRPALVRDVDGAMTPGIFAARFYLAEPNCRRSRSELLLRWALVTGLNAVNGIRRAASVAPTT
jgi:hypothetical protein